MTNQTYYLKQLPNTKILKSSGIHYFISALMIAASLTGLLNSCVVMKRSAVQNAGRSITTWLLLDSLFETSRVVYVFMSEIVLRGSGPMQLYELLISAAQYCEYGF